MSGVEANLENASLPSSSDATEVQSLTINPSATEDITGETAVEVNDTAISSANGITSGAIAAAETEKKLAHFKRLIVQSRQMLENYQKQLAEKDRILNNIQSENAELVERMKLQAVMEQKKMAAEAQAANAGMRKNPVLARRRVNDEDGSIWVLFEFDDEIVEWRSFSNEVGLNDFVRRESGEPMVLPPPSLDPEEVEALVARSDKAVAKITDEFKRFRVKSEIMRKQKDAEAKQASTLSVVAMQRHRQLGDEGEAEKRAAQAEAQVDSLMEEMAEKEDKWQRMISELKRDKEKLLSQGSEVPIATQWRQRFEQCQREKNDLVAKLNIRETQSPPPKTSTSASLHDLRGDSSPPPNLSSPSNEQDLPRRFAELRDEYKLYRKRAMEAIAEKDMNIASLRGTPLNHASLTRSGSMPEDPKLQYLKNLMLKYLCTDEFEAKEHMERAITTILLFTDSERNFIAERRADASASWMVNWMGNQTNT